MTSENSSPRTLPDRAWVPYVVPMATFLILTSLEGYLPKAGDQAHPTWYPAAYAVKILLVSAACVLCRRVWSDYRPFPGPGLLIVSIVSGAAVAAVWIGIDGRYPTFAFLGSRSAFDPSSLSTAMKVGFLLVRFFGLVILVPLFEELFWRSFLNRWVIDPSFLSIPIDRVTWISAGATSVLFALSHPEWLPAFLTAAAWALLLKKGGSLSACYVSHATANLGLGLYSLATGDWRFL